MSPGRLELEITEGVLRISTAAWRCSAAPRRSTDRFRWTIFGSGYSSLSYLQAFPFDKIKLDRAFVINLGRNRQSAVIISAVIDRGRWWPKRRKQLTFLAQEGGEAVQGDLIGKPLPIGQYAALVGRSINVMEPARKAG